MPNRNRDLSRDPSRVLILPRACARRVKHNAHPRTSVHAPWRPNAPQNRQGSQGHPEFPKTKPTRPGTPKRPRTCPPCNTIRTRVARSTSHGVRTRTKTIRVPGHTPKSAPKHPETPPNLPGGWRLSSCSMALGQFSFYRSWHHQNFRRVGKGPHRQNSQIPNSARLSDQTRRIVTDLFS